MAAHDADEERPDVAELLPVDKFRTVLDLLPEDAIVTVSAEEEIAPSLNDHWEDVTTSFHDKDAHHLYLSPDELTNALDRKTRLKLSSISGDQPHEFRAQEIGRAHV